MLAFGTKRSCIIESYGWEVTRVAAVTRARGDHFERWYSGLSRTSFRHLFGQHQHFCWHLVRQETMKTVRVVLHHLAEAAYQRSTASKTVHVQWNPLNRGQNCMIGHDNFALCYRAHDFGNVARLYVQRRFVKYRPRKTVTKIISRKYRSLLVTWPSNHDHNSFKLFQHTSFQLQQCRSGAHLGKQ